MKNICSWEGGKCLIKLDVKVHRQTESTMKRFSFKLINDEIFYILLSRLFILHCNNLYAQHFNYRLKKVHA